MTNYEQGFLTKCAEHGVPEHVAVQLLKKADIEDTLFKPVTGKGGVPTESSEDAYDFIHGTDDGTRSLFNTALSNIWNAYGKYLKKPKKNKAPFVLGPRRTIPKGIRKDLEIPVSSMSMTGALTPSGSNIVSRAVLDKIPVQQHTPDLSNAVWNAFSNLPVPTNYKEWKKVPLYYDTE